MSASICFLAPVPLLLWGAATALRQASRARTSVESAPEIPPLIVRPERAVRVRLRRRVRNGARAERGADRARD